MSGHDGETLLISGLPGFRALRLVQHLLSVERGANLIALLNAADVPGAEQALLGLDATLRARLRLVVGDPLAMDFGLNGPLFLELARSVDRVYHFASRLEGPSVDQAARDNVSGARELIEFARACTHLRGVVVLSSAFVSGTRSGVVRETELSVGQRFRGPLDESLATVEQMLERHAELRALIVRPTQIVGDSRSGEIDHAEWPYPLMAWVANGPEEIALALPRAHAHVQVVPIDFVIQATHFLASDPDSYGRRFHLLDEQPPTVEELVVLLAEQCNKRTAPAFNALTRGLASGNFRLISDSVRSLFDVQGADALYDATQADSVLKPAGICCPALESYLPALLEFARRELFRPHKEARLDA